MLTNHRGGESTLSFQETPPSSPPSTMGMIDAAVENGWLDISKQPHRATRLVKQTMSLHVTYKQVSRTLSTLRGIGIGADSEARGHWAPDNEIESEIKCTPAQQELLLRDPGAAKRAVVIRLDLSTDIVKSFDQLHEAWHALALQHHMLRATVGKEKNGGGFSLRIFKRPRNIQGSFDANLEYIHSFGLQGPAMPVVEWASTAPHVSLCLPQLVADSTSLGHLWRDFLCFLSGGVPAPRLSFPHYLSLVREKASQESAGEFWFNTLRSLPDLVLHSFPLERSHTFQNTDAACSIAISGSSLRRCAKQLGVSEHAVVYAALGLVLDRHCNLGSEVHDIAFVAEGRDRTIEAYGSVIGHADQEYPLKLQVKPELTAAALIKDADHLNTLSATHAFFAGPELLDAISASGFKLSIALGDDDAALMAASGNSRHSVTITVQISHAVSITAQHDTAIPVEKMTVVLDHLVMALSEMVRHPNFSLSEIDIISPEELDLMLEMGKPLTQPLYDNVHKLFEGQARLTPNAPALQFEGDRPLSYDELNRISNRVARQLPAGRGSFVPVCLQRSANLIISLVAILKTGAAYVTMDPDTPQDRNNFIVEDVGAQVVIVDRTTAGRFPGREVAIEHLIAESAQADDTNLDRGCEPSDPVYVIYTSGSTGKPKGVLHIHSSATSGLAAFPTLPDLRQLLFHNPVFSAAQRSVWSTLKQGGCLCLASKDNLTVHIGRTINQMQINVIDVTPSTALLLTPGTVPCLKRMTVAGELINPALIPTWADELELLNAYGLSENTQINWRREMVLGQNPQNIGRPSDTTTSFVLVPGTTRLSPLLVPGELCLGGHQLALYYINRPEKTAEAFIDNPFGPGRLYRTGDMVVAHEDGSIEMVGRIDFQVKINGQRVEPGDSNTILQTHPDVSNSSVVAAEIAGRKALVAAIVAKRPALEWPRLRSELKDLLAQHIPSYMMPTYWLLQNELPLNVNGKVDIPRLTKDVERLDRGSLLRSSTDHHPHHQGMGGASSPDEEAITHLAAPAGRLCEILVDILKLPASRIATSNNTFQELGGSSLDAIHASTRAYHDGVEVSVGDILRLPLRTLLEHAKQSQGNHSDVPQLSLLPRNTRISKMDDVEDAYPTTSLQDSFLADTLQGRSTYVYRRYYRLKGKSAQQVRQTLESLVPRLPLLRTTFVPNKTSFLQVIRKMAASLSWEDLPLTTVHEYSALQKQSMQLGGNFVHFASLKEGILAVTMHHALFDYWSNNFLIDDLSAALSGRSLPQRPGYANFVREILKLQQGEQEQLAEFWRDKLAGAAPAILGQATGEEVVVETVIAQDVQATAASHKVSIGSLIYAAWTVVLSMHLVKNDILFGVTLSGRDMPVEGILDMAGPTIATVPFRVQVDTEMSLLNLARTIQDDIWDISPKAQFGLRNILKEASLSPTHYDTLVNVLIKDDTEAAESWREDGPIVRCEPHEPNFVGDTTMLEAETTTGSGLRLRLLSHLTHTKASLLLGNVAETIKAFLARPDVPIGHIIATSAEEVKFLDSLSKVCPTEPGLTALTLVDRMIAQYPEKTALQGLSSPDLKHKTTLSYRQFGDAVAGLAHYLGAKGVKTGDIIPICMRKSINTLIAVFGVLKTGAAFTPLDPKNPRDRNEFIARDVGATLAITDSAHADVFESFAGDVLNLDTVDAITRDDVDDGLAADLREPSVGDLAYVIYTSGSTGLPKGVQVHHGAVGASTEGMIEACGIDSRWHVLWFLNYVFDASYFDVFTVLGSGGTVSIADQDTLMQDLTACVNAFGAEQLMITPTISKLISPEQVPTLKTLLVCGEPITPEIASVWATKMDVYNGYGPTEATILMTVSKVVPGGNLKSIGRPLKAVHVSILHPELLAPVPYGTVGELCVSGGQVAIGYLNRPDITAKSFLAAENGSVLYRTGDYARWLPTGEIECLGRRDNQVKLNGFRIELGEIENTILTQAADIVQTCVVGVGEVQRKKQIVVYYVPVEKPDGKEAESSSHMYSAAIVNPAVILDRLQSLAHYMMPKVFLPFERFPLLPSGKINRKRLAELAEALDPKTLAGYSTTLPTTNGQVVDDSELTMEEKTLRDAWAELFDVLPESIDLNALFYNYGGDSIAAINLASMLRQHNFSLSVNDVVTYPSLKEQAQRIKPVTSASSALASAVKLEVSQMVRDKLRVSGLSDDDVEDIYHCGPGQVEFLTQGHSEEQFWMLMTVRRLPSGFDLERWIDLTRRLTQANQILRAMYVKQDAADPLSWMQVILKKPMLDLELVDCPSPDGEEKGRLLRRHWDERFSVGRPFVRYLILRYPDGAMDLVTKLDHAMYDGTLLRIFDDQFTALRDGHPLPVSPTSFKTFVEYTNLPSLREPMLAFWKSTLAGNRFSFPSHIPNPKVSGVIVARTSLPVNAYAQSAGVTASIVFQAAYTLLLARLSRYSSQSSLDVTYDYLLTGRNVDLDDPQLIPGTCANFLPFRARMGDSTNVQSLLKDTQSGFWAMTENGSVSLGDIYRHAVVGGDRETLAAKTLFLFQPFEPAPAEQDHMRWIVMAMSKVTMYVNYAIMFEVFKDVNGAHRLKMGYDTRLFGTKVEAEGVLQTYLGIVEDIVEGKKTQVSELVV
ncbi:putative linear gramicidin synthetase [Triangularia setosa]|uniref:Linear gramicidin synthetase n=1 Tax=Triangularia setosa TaxID=2587417 RepID=A0AAN7A534_9PEZI|nr:putative linear gramicidin synthetase [Podospora setosa]